MARIRASGVRAVLVVPARMTRSGLLAYPRQNLSRPGADAPRHASTASASPGSATRSSAGPRSARQPDAVHHHWRGNSGTHPVLRFLAACHPQLNDPSAITRPVLDDYMWWLLTEGTRAATRALSLSMIRVFGLEQQRNGQWR